MSKGDYNSKKIYNENPLEVAKEFEDAGIHYLHLVDLDGAKSKHVVNYKILEQICVKTNLKVDFGGGIKSDEDIKIAFESGANQITGGSIAVKDAELFESWIKTYGSEKIILGADAMNGKIATDGWLETSEMELIPFIKEYQSKGIEYVICTDISKDGMLEGSANDLYRDILDQANIKLIASGGVTSMKDIEELIEMKCDGAIIGKAIYEGRITLKELSTLC